MTISTAALMSLSPSSSKLSRLRNRLIVVLGRQKHRSGDHTNSIEEQHHPADGAQNEGLVQLPAYEEPVVVLEQIRLCNRQ